MYYFSDNIINPIHIYLVVVEMKEIKLDSNTCGCLFVRYGNHVSYFCGDFALRIFTALSHDILTDLYMA